MPTTTINDLKRRSLTTLGYTGSVDDMYRKYLQGISGSSLSSINDLETPVLGGSGSHADRWRTHLNLHGITKKTLDDALYTYWNTVGASGLNIPYLFRNNEVGVWFDPSDLTSMFQDSAGTTAAVVGQPVGLMLDKSQGGGVGAELVDTANDFATWTNTLGGNNILEFDATESAIKATFVDTQYGGDVALTEAGGLTANLVVGKSYRVEFYAKVNTGSVVFDAINAGGNIFPVIDSTSFTLNSVVIVPTNASVVFRIRGLGAGEISWVKGISVKELPGYHATQATSTARGTLGTNLIDYDGIDDSAAIATGAGGGSTGFFLCTAVRVDGGAGTVRVIYSDAGTNTGYIVRINASNQLELAAGNGTTYTLAATTDTLTAGPYVVTAWDDGSSLNVQVNNGTAGTAVRPVVSAGTATATVAKDNGAATSFFNGAIYTMIYVKNAQNVTDADRTVTKSYIANKAGVAL